MNKKYTISPFTMCVTINNNENNNIFPRPLRCLIIGSSGCGKTSIAWNIITKRWINYQKLYVFTKSLDQPIYKALQELFNESLPIAEFFEHCDDIIPVDECCENSLIIFDDCILEKQDKMRDYFVRGRHKNISCIYLTQCYTLADLKTIRNNCNFIITFKQNDHYLKKIWSEFASSDYNFNDFKTICENVWKNDHDFLTIDLTKNKYMHSFDNINGSTIN